MATITLQAARAAHDEDAKIGYYPEAASQSFKQGQVVYLNSGALTVCASDATTLIGIANRDASGTTGTMIPVVKAYADTEFIMNVYHGTPGDAVSAWTLIDTGPWALVVANNKCYVDISDDSHDAINIVEMYEGDTVGDTYGRVIVKFLAAVSQVEDI